MLKNNSSRTKRHFGELLKLAEEYVAFFELDRDLVHELSVPRLLGLLLHMELLQLFRNLLFLGRALIQQAGDVLSLGRGGGDLLLLGGFERPK